MFTRRIIVSTLATGAVALVVAVAQPAVAAAAAKVAITAGGKSGKITFTATNTNTFKLVDLRSGLIISCPVGGISLTGLVTVTTAGPTILAATITAGTFTNCKYNNIAFSITGTFPWNVNAPNQSSPVVSGGTASGQTTVGNISNVKATAVVGSCSVGFGDGAGNAGTIAPATYSNLSMPTLTARTTATAALATLGVNSISTSPCSWGAIQAGDKAQITGADSSGNAQPAAFSITAKDAANAAANPLWASAY